MVPRVPFGVRRRLATLLVPWTLGSACNQQPDPPGADQLNPPVNADVVHADVVNAAPPKTTSVLTGPVGTHDYQDVLTRLEQTRRSFAKRIAEVDTKEDEHRVLAQARVRLLDEIRTALLPAWSGTPWAMNGMATEPGETPIACGYFVATILRDAGVELHRIKFGQAAALRIQKATTPPGVDVHRFFSIPPAQLAKKIVALGEGVYIIGLDTHVGFVVVHDGEARFVHSSYTDARVVTDEPLATAQAIANSQSHGYFVSELFSNDAAVRLWLQGTHHRLPA